ncbi:AI-2E family transporter [Streptomyces violaceorubidus]
MASTDETGQPPGAHPQAGSTPPSGPPSDGTVAGPGARMPRWLPAMVLALALIAGFQLGSWAFHQLTGLLINVLIAFFLALAIEPAVSWMAGRGMRRGSPPSSSSSPC